MRGVPFLVLLIAGGAAVGPTTAASIVLDVGYSIFDVDAAAETEIALRVFGEGGTVAAIFAWQGREHAGAGITIGINSTTSAALWTPAGDVSRRVLLPEETRGGVGIIVQPGTTRVLLAAAGPDVNFVEFGHGTADATEVARGTSVHWREVNGFESGPGAQVGAYLVSTEVAVRTVSIENAGRFIGFVGQPGPADVLGRTYVLSADTPEGQKSCPCAFYGSGDPDGLPPGELSVAFTGARAGFHAPVVFGVDVPEGLLFE